MLTPLNGSLVVCPEYSISGNRCDMYTGFAMGRLVCLSVLFSSIALFSCSHPATAPSAPPPPVAFSVTGSAKTVQISYSQPHYSISILAPQSLPFTFTWPVPPNQFQLVLLSAQITTVGDIGTVRASVSERRKN